MADLLFRERNQQGKAIPSAHNINVPGPSHVPGPCCPNSPLSPPATPSEELSELDLVSNILGVQISKLAPVVVCVDRYVGPYVHPDQH